MARGFGRSVEAARPWLASLILHTVGLMCLALWVLPKLGVGRIENLSASISPDQAVTEFSVADPVSEPEVANEVDRPISLSQMVETNPVQFDLIDLPERNELGDEVEIAEFVPVKPQSQPAATARAASTLDEVRSTDGVASASDVVTSSIRGELSQGDTLVVWLLDASISLSENRETLAHKTGVFYESVNSLNTSRNRYDGEYTLMSSVVSFGKSWGEVLRPTRMGAKAIEAMRRVRIDTSGIENVMSAVESTVRLYRDRRHWHDRMVVVVLTDESGDDVLRLESTIQLCRDENVAVHVIGPSAVMGCQKGSQHCTLRQGDVNFSFWLTVNKGPETSLPERLLLPYWHESSLPAWRQNGATAGHSNWYGGVYRERLPSGFGPYALTRLALQTGGSFTMFERLPMQASYERDVLREYTPDYGSLQEYLGSLDGKPLRQFVHEAASMGYQQSELLVAPRMTFMGGRSPFYPYEVEHYYFSPADFRSRFAAVLTKERARVVDAVELLGRFVSRLNNPSIDWEYEYTKEESKRWRAWYDLTKGRILATQARYLEYLATTGAIENILSRETNEVTLYPASVLRHPDSQLLVNEAMRCLERCRSEHGQTPWADLAGWELDSSVGLRVQQSTVPRPPPRIGGPTRAPEQFSFPNL